MKALAAVLLAALVAAPPPDVLTVASARGERRIPVVADRGFPAVPALQLGSVLTIVASGAAPRLIAMRAADRNFEFVLDSAVFRFDERVYPISRAPYVVRDTVFLPLHFLTETLPRLMSWRFRYDSARVRLEELSGTSLSVAPSTAVAAPAPGPSPSPSTPASHSTPRRRRVVAIDAGHGGVDPGMRGPIGRRTPLLREKEVTFAVARHVSRELQAKGFGTYMTRDRDTLINLSHRGRRAGQAGADIFLSIHVNAADPRGRNAASARGFEVYFLGEALTEDARRVAAMENAAVRFETEVTTERGDPLATILRDLAQNEHLRESGRLAELVQASLGRVHPGVSRGVKQAPYTVLYTSYMPAILIETGFGSNDAEARFLVSDAGQRRLARAIADGVAAYLAEYERRLDQ